MNTSVTTATYDPVHVRGETHLEIPQIINPMHRSSCLSNQQLWQTATLKHTIHLTAHHTWQCSQRTKPYIRSVSTHEVLQASSSWALYTTNAACIASVMAFTYKEKNTHAWNSYVAFRNDITTSMSAAIYGPQIMNPKCRLSCLRNRRLCNSTTWNRPYQSYYDHICTAFKHSMRFHKRGEERYCCNPLVLVSWFSKQLSDVRNPSRRRLRIRIVFDLQNLSRTSSGKSPNRMSVLRECWSSSIQGI